MSAALRVTPPALALFSLALTAPEATAQQVVVVDAREVGTGWPVQDARLELVDAPGTGIRSALTDASGRATFLEVGAGVWTLRITTLEYEKRDLRIEVPPDTTTFVSVELTPAPISLDSLLVTTDRLDPLLLDVGFYEREAGNRGLYYGPERIERIAGRTRLTSMFRYMSPLRASMTRGGRRVLVYIQRADRCFPTLYLDGVRVRGFDVDNVVDPNEVIGVEVYDKAHLVPIRFRTAEEPDCAVVIWTRRH